MSLDLRSIIRNVPDFPKPGIMFRDVTPLFGHPAAFRQAVDALSAPFRANGIDAVAAIESRGFVFGGAMAYNLGARFIPIRKAGKLPYDTYKAEYALEYGQGVLEVHTDAVTAGEKILLVDDLVATGGTAAASIRLLRKMGAEVVGCAFLIELAFLPWREKLGDVRSECLISYADENP